MAASPEPTTVRGVAPGGSDGIACFVLPEGMDERSLAGVLECSVIDRHRVRRRWYDTFDWRLWDAGLVLEVEGVEPSLRVTARDRTDHRVRWEARVGFVPNTTAELPHGPWRRSLGPLLGNRALVEAGSEVVEATRLTATDEAGKTVALVLVDRLESGDRRARIVPLVGYDRAARSLRRRLADEPGVEASQRHPLFDATVGGRCPQDDDNHFGAGIEVGWPAHRGVAELLERLHATMTDNLPYLVGWPPDTEFLHDYRVAVRRSRSVLKMAAGVVGPQDRRRARELLRHLQASTGRSRDLDVMAEDLLSWRAELGDGGCDLDPLLQLVEAEQATARAEVARVLASEDHARADRAYREVLARMRDPAPDAPEATSTVGEVAAARITRAYRRMVRAGRAVDDSSPASAVHQVRIRGKELRYAVEAFTAVLDPEAAGDFTHSLKRFQNLLGAYNDASVQAGAIEDLSHQLAGQGPDAVRAVMAAGRLTHQLGQRQEKLRRGFADALASFDSKATRRQLRAMLAPAVQGRHR